MKERRIRTCLWRMLAAMLLCCMGGVQLAAQPFAPLFAPRKQEVRAVWLTTFRGLDWPTTPATSPATIEQQKRELTGILDRLQEAKVNVVIFQTRVRGNVVYPSEYESWSEPLSGKAGVSPGYDPLAFAIDECHKRGMELHAWMVAVPLGSEKVHKEMGESSITRRNPKICKKFNKHWYLNPSHPEAHRYLATLVNELVSNYDVDGVHLDYIRYPDRPKRFPDAADFRKYGKGRDLAQWRRDNITGLVRAVYQEVKSVKPWVKVSSAPLGKYRDTKRYPSLGWNAYHAVYQEAQTWMHEGIQDLIFPMLYYRDNHFFPFVLDWKEQSCGRLVVPGLGIYFLDPSEGNWTLPEVESQLNFIRWSGCAGEAHFRSRFLTDNTQGLYDRIQEHFYYTHALLPATPWLDSIPPVQPERAAWNVTRPAITMAWHPSADNLEGGVSYNIYKSATWPIDLSNPENLVAVRLRDTTYTQCICLPEERGHFFAVTATDRCGNESEPLYFNPYIPSAEQVQPLPDEVLRSRLQRLVPDDEGVVTLPEHFAGNRVVVATIAGREVARLPFHNRLRMNNLLRGCYLIAVENEDGHLHKVGIFIK